MKKSIIYLFMMIVLCFELSSCTKNISGTKVIGGKEVNEEELFFPAVAITIAYENSIGLCTASVVSHNTLLTAAHCFASNKDKNGNIIKPTMIEVIYQLKNENGDIQGYKKQFHSYAFHNNFLGQNNTDFYTYDIAVIRFADNTFKDIKPFTILPKTVPVGTQVILVGYGCLTKVTVDGNGVYSIQCDEAKQSLSKDKRAGVNRVVTTNYCNEGMIQLEQRMIRDDASLSSFDGLDAVATGGDSGGPILYRGENGQMYVAGIVSWSPKGFGQKGGYMSTTGRPDCFTNPVLNSNLNFLKERVMDMGINVPGINISIGIVELNGKIRVVEKQYDNIYTNNIQNIPFTISNVSLSGGSMKTIKTSQDLTSFWNSLSLENRSRLNWN